MQQFNYNIIEKHRQTLLMNIINEPMTSVKQNQEGVEIWFL
jgi:hypothetical protein